MRYLLISLIFFTTSSFATDFYQWSSSSYSSMKFDTPDLACAYVVSKWTNPSPYSTKTGEHQVSFNTVINFDCKAQTISKSNGSISYSSVGGVNRSGSECPPDTNYNQQTGACEVDCAATTGTTEYQVFQVSSRESVDDPFPDPSTYEVTVPASVCSSSCRYVNQSTDPVTCGSLNGTDRLGFFCYAPLVGTGEKCQAGDTPQQGPQDFGGPTPVEPTDPNDPTDPANNCGPNHVWSGSTCAPVFNADEDGGDSGGDTGGGDTGGGDSGGGDTGGGDSGGDGSGDGSGDGGSNGGGGSGNDGDTTPYDPSAEWSDGEASALGSATGTSIAGTLTDSVDGALEERDSEIEDALDQVPEQVSDMLGDLPGLSFMDNLFVPAAGCSEIVIPFELGQYSAGMAVDFCVLSKYKALLEWVIWCLTGIAVWNVYYSGLRLQNASASRGGF